MQLARWLVPLAVGATLANACGAVTKLPPDQPSSSPQALGLIQGHVLRGPGQDPRAGGGSAAQVPVAGDPIEIRNPDGKLIASAVSSQDGSFRVEVAGGTYMVVESICATKKQVEVRPPAVTELTLSIPTSC